MATSVLLSERLAFLGQEASNVKNQFNKWTESCVAQMESFQKQVKTSTKHDEGTLYNLFCI